MLFNVPLNTDLTLSGFGEETLFCYDQFKKPSSLLCTSLYDSLIFEKIGSKAKEHNLKNFLLDSLQTCWNYQNQRVRRNCKDPIKLKEHRLLYLSLYI